MKAISLFQPWASLIAVGCKTMETRSWYTSYRGELAIAATARVPAAYVAPANELLNDRDIRRFLEPYGWVSLSSLPMGCIVARAKLVSCYPTDHDFVAGRLQRWRYERACGDYRPNRFAWVFSEIDGLAEPIAAKGRQGLWNVPDELAALIRSARALP